MQCESCGQRPATVHRTLIINGHKQESHLCEVCAQAQGQMGMISQGGFSFPNLSIQQLLSSFLGQLGQDSFSGPTVSEEQTEPKCKNCGMTYSEFSESGKLGCAKCYDYLEPHLVPLVKRIHGTTAHTGKAPKRTGGIVRKQRELELMKRQLQTAIQQEQYEEAARLRDVIKEAEGQLGAGGDSNALG